MITIKVVENQQELQEILEIQTQNHLSNLSKEFKEQKGYVTVKHTMDMLTKMNSKAPQIIAKSDNEVVAFALAMPKEFKNLIPVLIPMFETFEKIDYKGTKLHKLNYYVMGQICVRDDFKRKGIFKKLYQKHCEIYASQYDYCVTEVSSNNKPSMLAHQKVGFKTIYTFTDETDQWNIMLWDWK